MAPPEVIEARAIGDAADPWAKQWRLDNLDRCVAAFADPLFGEHVDATRPADAIAKELACRAGHVGVDRESIDGSQGV